MIPFKGKSIMKQHIPNKPIRWGYKMFLLALVTVGFVTILYYTWVKELSRSMVSVQILFLIYGKLSDVCGTTNFVMIIIPPLFIYKLN